MRQHMTLCNHFPRDWAGSWRRTPGLGRVAGQEWIPRPDCAAIEQDSQTLVGKEAMEDHSEMLLHLVRQVDEVLYRVSFGNYPVQYFPQDHGAFACVDEWLEKPF